MCSAPHPPPDVCWRWQGMPPGHCAAVGEHSTLRHNTAGATAFFSEAKVPPPAASPESVSFAVGVVRVTGRGPARSCWRRWKEGGGGGWVDQSRLQMGPVERNGWIDSWRFVTESAAVKCSLHLPVAPLLLSTARSTGKRGAHTLWHRSVMASGLLCPSAARGWKALSLGVANAPCH